MRPTLPVYQTIVVVTHHAWRQSSLSFLNPSHPGTTHRPSLKIFLAIMASGRQQFWKINNPVQSKMIDCGCNHHSLTCQCGFINHFMLVLQSLNSLCIFATGVLSEKDLLVNIDAMWKEYFFGIKGKKSLSHQVVNLNSWSMIHIAQVTFVHEIFLGGRELSFCNIPNCC